MDDTHHQLDLIARLLDLINVDTSVLDSALDDDRSAIRPKLSCTRIASHSLQSLSFVFDCYEIN